MTGSLSQLSIPTLVLAGSDDVITPASEMREMAAGIANSEFIVLPGVGHLSALEAPVEFNTVLARFLARKVGTLAPAT
jgi:3-oxoadipate enol-lactonase